MYVEGSDRTAFRFTRGELAALMKLMGIKSFPEMYVTAAPPDAQTEMSLVESGVLAVCGERMLVHGVIVAVLRSMAESRRCLWAAADEARIALYRGRRMCVLAEERGPQLVVLEPFPDAQAARRLFFGRLNALNASAALRRGEGQKQGDAAQLYAQFEEE